MLETYFGAENLLIDYCLLRNTTGMAPAADIDFELNDPAGFLTVSRRSFQVHLELMRKIQRVRNDRRQLDGFLER